VQPPPFSRRFSYSSFYFISFEGITCNSILSVLFRHANTALCVLSALTQEIIVTAGNASCFNRDSQIRRLKEALCTCSPTSRDRSWVKAASTGCQRTAAPLLDVLPSDLRRPQEQSSPRCCCARRAAETLRSNAQLSCSAAQAVCGTAAACQHGVDTHRTREVRS
jgi:hypothetical protein